MRMSLVANAVVAALIGFGGTIALVIEAAHRLNATPAELISWVVAVCFAQTIAGVALSFWHRIPVVIAWSTPGAALIAAAPPGADMHTGVGAFLLAAGLICVTAIVRPLTRLIEQIPPALGAAMLAGVLLHFILLAVASAQTQIVLVLSILAVFLVGRLLTPALAAIEALIAGILLSLALHLAAPMPASVVMSSLVYIEPRFDPATLVGIGLPLFLVTMASQNLPGAAVLRTQGYVPPMSSILGVTGAISMVGAVFGAHTVNLAALTAAMCTGPDTHPDMAKRWPAGVIFGLCFAVFGIFAAPLIGVLTAMPVELIRIVAGLALIGALGSALTAALASETDRFAALLTFAVTASGLTFAGIGAPFWGLLIGLLVLALQTFKSGVLAGPDAFEVAKKKAS